MASLCWTLPNRRLKYILRRRLNERIRKYWEKKRDFASLTVLDKIATALKAAGLKERLSYNKHHVALGSTGNNLCWFHPRRTVGFCHIESMMSSELRDEHRSNVQKAGIDALARSTDRKQDAG